MKTGTHTQVPVPMAIGQTPDLWTNRGNQLKTCPNMPRCLSPRLFLTDSDKKYFDDKEKSNKASKKTELSYLVKDFLKTTDCKMFFVYGENDPWTGAAIDDPTNENVKKLVIKNGTHNDAIYTYTADESKQLMDFVKSILFPASATK